MLIEEIKKLMTPASVLSQNEFPEAEQILPSNCEDFDSLLNRRKDIQCLKYLPVKHQTVRDLYKSQKAVLSDGVDAIMHGCDIVYAVNQFPYFLPPDVIQGIVWVNDEVTEDRVLEFIANFVSDNLLLLPQIIMFERPRNATQLLVRGTYPSKRHIHLWTRNA